MFNTKNHCNDVSSGAPGAKEEFYCDECDRIFKTKSGRNRHKTVTHKKEKEKKDDMMKRTRSIPQKNNSINFRCNDCNYSARSKWALKAHINHKHKESTSPNEKKPRVNAVIVENILPEVQQSIPIELAKSILSEVVENIPMDEEVISKCKITIEPTKEFLTNTAATLAEMLESIEDQIDENYEEDDDETKDLEDRLDILRGDEPRNRGFETDDSENTLVTLPLKDVEDLRLKLRNLEEINEQLTISLNDVSEMKITLKNLKDTNKELTQKLKESEERNRNKKKEPKKNKEPSGEKFIVIDMETDDDMDIGQLITNKQNGYSRSNPQGEALKKKDTRQFTCRFCEKNFNKEEQLRMHLKTHEVNCSLCGNTFQNKNILEEHERIYHDEMICHTQCEGGQCIRGETESNQNINLYNCNFCDKAFISKNLLSRHKADVHKSFKPCRDTNNCVYQGGCYYSHVPVPIGKVRCYQCGEEFDSKNTMMIHRKVHGGVKDCQRFINSTCDRGDHCWWNHQTTQQVFQQVKENLPPPIPQVPQNLPHQILVNMLTVMDLELKKIKEVLNIN